MPEWAQQVQLIWASLPAPFQGLATVVAITVVGVMLIKVLDRI